MMLCAPGIANLTILQPAIQPALQSIPERDRRDGQPM